ncbi:uncharacterized protein LOC126906556 isoform X2 [Daktulosphaira vitifoliae]|uniref:uncharacterized protein LOC126906556 isoform X2 n=1 Tax=Daktulosphaira vitifoliae TaxID=58002 RepID=UPI0021AAC2CA|nr:uncharacterized protein LOC126906556 isoform X2 [Daktulosphaira vitifoliae]
MYTKTLLSLCIFFFVSFTNCFVFCSDIEFLNCLVRTNGWIEFEGPMAKDIQSKKYISMSSVIPSNDIEEGVFNKKNVFTKIFQIYQIFNCKYAEVMRLLITYSNALAKECMYYEPLDVKYYKICKSKFVNTLRKSEHMIGSMTKMLHLFKPEEVDNVLHVSKILLNFKIHVIGNFMVEYEMADMIKTLNEVSELSKNYLFKQCLLRHNLFTDAESNIQKAIFNIDNQQNKNHPIGVINNLEKILTNFCKQVESDCNSLVINEMIISRLLNDDNFKKNNDSSLQLENEILMDTENQNEVIIKLSESDGTNIKKLPNQSQPESSLNNGKKHKPMFSSLSKSIIFSFFYKILQSLKSCKKLFSQN